MIRSVPDSRVLPIWWNPLQRRLGEFAPVQPALGEGGFSFVYGTRHPNVAVKVSGDETERWMSLIQKERRYPGIIQVFDAFPFKGKWVTVMERARRPDFSNAERAWLTEAYDHTAYTQTPAGPSRYAKLMEMPVPIRLRELHAVMRVLERPLGDVKASNVGLDRTGNIVLIDLGQVIPWSE